MTPVATSVESSLWFSFAQDGPSGVVPDWFAGLMDFWIRIDEPGQRQFSLNADDRIWLWLDGWRRNAPVAGQTGSSTAITGAEHVMCSTVYGAVYLL
jgi:hypothetical protein